MKISILDEKGEYVREAGTDEIGVVCIKGPCIFKGYVEETHNKDIWLKDGWFNTGDLGRNDKDGFFWLTGRKKDLIIRGGHNIDPVTIEEPIYRMKGVKVVAAVGRPDPHAGEVPVVYVEVSKDSGINNTSVMEWASSNIGERAAVPKEVIIIDHIPLTAVGKIFKPALKWDVIKRTYEKELAKLGELAESLEISVGEDKIYGTNASIKIKPASGVGAETVRKRASEILANYTVHYDIITE
jgi:fatty-acyl-CoA synthase